MKGLKGMFENKTEKEAKEEILKKENIDEK